jgi:hypothetical protein
MAQGQGGFVLVLLSCGSGAVKMSVADHREAVDAATVC